MKNHSFRSIIIATLIIVVASISYSSFHLYSHLLENRIFSESYDHDAFRRKAGLIFTITMVTMVAVIMLIIHYRFVRRSLREFNTTINLVNKGDLHTRLSIPETKELGRLGRSFNDMLDTFQKAMAELEEFHKKELRSNYKLATIGEMSARLAHEIRNPATGIANAVEIMIKESKNSEDKAILVEIRRQANRVNDAVSDLLKYSREKDIDLIINNFNDITKSVVFFLESQVDNKDIKFKSELDEDIPSFRFDSEQLEDVLLNLGLNAVQAIGEEGTITFKTEYNKSENRLLLHVSDNGKGIDEEDISSIFHPFFTTRTEGTGLGLAIVKDTIEKHSGEIWAKNNNTGGCTFTVVLPIVRD